jgi:hypothetical protein
VHLGAYLNIVEIVAAQARASFHIPESVDYDHISYFQYDVNSSWIEAVDEGSHEVFATYFRQLVPLVEMRQEG